VRRWIDVVGSALFTVAIASLMIALTEVGQVDSRLGLIAAGVFCLSSVLFAMQERRAVDPMISFQLWSHRPIAIANGTAALASMALMGLTTFLPMYVQGVLHRSPVVAGLTLTMMLFGWPITATLAARSLHRFTLRQILIAGSVLVPIGTSVFVFLTPQSSPLVAALGSLVLGFGMGLLSVSALILIQEIVDRSQRGIATASNVFARNLGSTLGATAFGAVFNYGLTHLRGGAVSSDQIRQILGASTYSAIDYAGIARALQHALNLTFWGMFVISLAVMLLALRVPSVEIRESAEAAVE